jgi:hypothetical protein
LQGWFEFDLAVLMRWPWVWSSRCAELLGFTSASHGDGITECVIMGDATTDSELFMPTHNLIAVLGSVLKPHTVLFCCLMILVI